ncbi:Hypothetical protein FKW44_011987, partial [Caligus rogercresseyi]
PQFREAQNCLSNNPDFNLLDYFFWASFTKGHEHSHGSVDQLKASIIKKQENPC